MCVCGGQCVCVVGSVCVCVCVVGSVWWAVCVCGGQSVCMRQLEEYGKLNKYNYTINAKKNLWQEKVIQRLRYIQEIKNLNDAQQYLYTVY